MVTGKKPAAGNNVSHANNKTKRRFSPNIQNHRFWVESEKRFVKLRVSTKGMRIIDKLGIDTVLADIRAKGARGRNPRTWRKGLGVRYERKNQISIIG